MTPLLDFISLGQLIEHQHLTRRLVDKDRTPEQLGAQGEVWKGQGLHGLSSCATLLALPPVHQPGRSLNPVLEGFCGDSTTGEVTGHW